MTTIDVMGIAFEVKIKKSVTVDGEEVVGVTDGPARTIEISKSKNPTPELMNSTLIHEICHAILYVSGQSHVLSSEQEEGVVLALEHGLSQMFTVDLEAL